LTSNRNSNELTSNIQHSSPVIQIALDTQGPNTVRTIALLDKSHDLYITRVKSGSKTFMKLGEIGVSQSWLFKNNNNL